MVVTSLCFYSTPALSLLHGQKKNDCSVTRLEKFCALDTL